MFEICGRILVLTVVLAFPFPLASHGHGHTEQGFDTYLEIRKLEHKLTYTEYRTDLEAEEKLEERERIALLLKAKRAEFQAEARGTNRKPASLSADKDALDFLQKRYPAPKRLSSLEWLAISEWFGTATQEAFLKTAFSVQRAQGARVRENANILWVEAPFQKLALESSDVFRGFSRWLRASERTRDFVKRSGLRTDSLQLSAFTRIDDQAEELFRVLKEKKSEGVFVVTTGEASAIMHRAMDLHPEMRDWDLGGWVNFNGRIYGLTPGGSAVTARRDPVRDMEREALSELHRLHGESMLPPPPLGEGFPIVNLVSAEGEARPAANLRESLVPEGESYFVQAGGEAESFRATLLSVGREPASLPNADWKEHPKTRDLSI